MEQTRSATRYLCAVLFGISVVWLITLAPGGPSRAEANPHPYTQTPALLSEEQVGSPDLLCRRAGNFVPLPILDMDVQITVTGVLVHGVVTQEFHNPYPDVIEAVYVFPVPERAAVHEMEMWIGERRIHSVIEDRGIAQKVYEEAKLAGRKAALVEQERPNLFTSSIANINPGETIRVRIEYQAEVSYESGRFSLTFPLTFTPRYVPDTIGWTSDPANLLHPVSTTVGDADRISPPFVREGDLAVPTATFLVEVRPGFEIQEIHSPSHAINVSRSTGSRMVRPQDRALLADRDFRLEWSLVPDTAPRTSVFIEPGGSESYALLMLIPPVSEGLSINATSAAGNGTSVLDIDTGFETETLFIIDVSGSMNGPSIVQAREALLVALDNLRPSDSFNLLRFNNHSATFGDSFAPGTESSIARAREWVRNLEATGGTEIYPAFVRGLQLMDRGDPSRKQRIIFMTDGAVGNEAQLFEAIHRDLGEVRLHTLGIGHAPNRYLMRKMAEYGSGLCAFVSATEQTENRVQSFLRRVRRPVLSDLTLQWEGVEIEEVFPQRLPDLHDEEPLFVSAKIRFRSSSGRVLLRGHTSEGEYQTSLSLSANARPESGIARQWARAKVGSLMDDLSRGSSEETIRPLVVTVAKDFKLVTQFTSLVAVEEVPSAIGPAQLAHVPNGLPHGSQLLGGGLPSGATSGPLELLLGSLLGSVGVFFGAYWLSRRT